MESQTPCHSSSHTHTQRAETGHPLLPPLSRCLTPTRLPRRGCSAWSSLKQTQGLAKAGERGTELPSLVTTFKSTRSPSPQHFICFTPLVAVCFHDFWVLKEPACHNHTLKSKKSHEHRLIYMHALLWKTHPWHVNILWYGKTPPLLRELQQENPTAQSATWSRNRTSSFPVTWRKNPPQVWVKGAALGRHHKPFWGNARWSLCKKASDVSKMCNKKKSYKKIQSQKPVLWSIKQTFSQQHNYFPF